MHHTFWLISMTKCFSFSPKTSTAGRQSLANWMQTAAFRRDGKIHQQREKGNQLSTENKWRATSFTAGGTRRHYFGDDVRYRRGRGEKNQTKLDRFMMISSSLCRIIPGNGKQPPQSAGFQMRRMLQLGTGWVYSSCRCLLTGLALLPSGLRSNETKWNGAWRN